MGSDQRGMCREVVREIGSWGNVGFGRYEVIGSGSGGTAPAISREPQTMRDCAKACRSPEH